MDGQAAEPGAGGAPGSQVSIWDLPERGERGPKPRYDRAAVAAAAVRIADSGGLGALTMRQVANELGIATMSLYNYVPGKDQLTQLMVDKLAGEYRYPRADPVDKRAAIAGLAGQARGIAQRHPWLADLLHRPTPPGPNGLRYLDYFLGLLAGSRLDARGRMEVIALISGFTTMYGAMQATLTQAGTGAAEHSATQVRAFAAAAASGHYPNLAAALAAGGPAPGDDGLFGSAIARLIDLAYPAGCAASE